MATIAHVRSFNGTTDNLEMNISGYETGWTDLTVAVIAKHDGVNASGWPWSIAGGGQSELAIGKEATNRVSVWSRPDASSGGSSQSADNVWTSAMGWCLVAASKPDGASTVRLHRYRYDTLSWTHVDGGLAGKDVNAPGASAQAWIGTYASGVEPFDGDIACVGVWKNVALSDGQVEGLISNITAWEALSPTGLWLLNQTDVTTSVNDRTGSANQIARNGTTAVAEATLTFDVGGAPPSSTSSAQRVLMLGVG